MVRSKTWGMLCLVLATLTACGDRTAQGDSTSAEILSSNSQAIGESNAASALAALKQQHQYLNNGHRPLAPAGAGAATPRLFGTPTPALPISLARHFKHDASGIVPVLLQQSRADLALPELANGTFRVLEKESGAHVQARLVGARPVQGVPSDGYVVYPRASPHGGTIVQRPTESGTEDYIEFAERPESASVSYEFQIIDGVAGLRLVGNTLEFLDKNGSPTLRVAAPSLVTAKGYRVAASLDVQGCDVDRDPRAPWQRTPVAPGADKCTLLLQWDNDAVDYPALLDPAWVSTGGLATARSGASAEMLPNGLVLVAGGRASDQWTCLDSAELYSPATRSFAATGSLATARCRQAEVRRANGQVIVIGGVDNTGAPLASTEIYDAGTGTWSSGAPLASAHADHRAALLNSGDVLVAGGTVDTAEKLSNSTSNWSSAGTLVAPAIYHTLTVIADGRVLLVGGSQAQFYLPSSNNWYPAPAPLASYHESHTATRLNNGQILVVGAQGPTTELFDSKSNAWSHAAAGSAARRGHSATLLADGSVVLAGGLDWNTPADLASEVYSSNWSNFAPGPGMLTPRSAHSAVLLSSGRVLLAGGMDINYNTLSSAEEFDPTALNTVITEYKLPAIVDAAVQGDRKTELWASVTRPSSLANGKRYPLLVFLHGNHGTCGTGSNPRHDYSCEYTDSGTCPQGYVVTPSHRGYDYITTTLAARGYIVVSINANRGITCGWGGADDSCLNLARGRLILRHLEQLSAWNRGVGTPPSSLGFSLANRLDLTQVGLLGHSRGGEGARAAYQQYRDAGSIWPSRIVDPITFRAIYEIGPVDGQTPRVLNAEGTRWNVLLPMCDGDVSDLEGVRPFDRMITNYSSQANAFAISTYTAWGANHNFFNTEWQDSDSGGCSDHRALFVSNGSASGSAEQRQVALRSVTEFFSAHVGTVRLPSLADLFNPEQPIAFDSRVERGYGAGQTASMSRPLEDFTQRAGYSTFNVQNIHSRVTVTHGTISEHDPALQAATIRWTSGGASTYFQTNFAASGSGFDLRSYTLLDFRIGRAKDALNIESSTQVNVQLVNADNSLSDTVAASGFGDEMVGPVGGPYGEYHQMLTTVRIPLAYFGSAKLSAIRGVRFTFADTPTGSIYLANVRTTQSTLAGTPSIPLAPLSAQASNLASGTTNLTLPGTRAVSLARAVTTGNIVASIKTTATGNQIEFTLTSTTPFLARNAKLVLDVGDQQSVLGLYPKSDLKRVVFTLDKTAFDLAQTGDRLFVHYQRGGGDTWEFGSLDKTKLDK